MNRRGFTLLEIMISLVILMIALTVAWQTFATATRAWTGARKLLDNTHHGDFVLTQLSAALRSMAFFEKNPEKYGFWIENNSGDLGDHSICWVTGHEAFMPRNSEFEYGLHRIQVGAGRDDDGNEGLLVTVWSHFMDEDSSMEKKSWVISENIKGLSCQVYNIDDENWDDKWEDTNSIPGLIEITLYAEPADRYDDPIEYRQLIEIPLGPPATDEITSPQ